MESEVRAACATLRTELLQCCERLERSLRGSQHFNSGGSGSPIMSPRGSAETNCTARTPETMRTADTMRTVDATWTSDASRTASPKLSPRGYRGSMQGMQLTSIQEDASLQLNEMSWAPVHSDPILLPSDQAQRVYAEHQRHSSANYHGPKCGRSLWDVGRGRSSQVVHRICEQKQADVLPLAFRASTQITPALSFGSPSNSREMISTAARRSQTIAQSLRHIHHMPVEQEENGTRLSQSQGVSPVLRSIVTSDYFDHVGTFFVASYAIFLGFETDYRAKHWMLPLPHYCALTENTFSAVFMLELSLRFLAFGRNIFHVPQGYWNLFDCIVIGVPFLAEVCTKLVHRRSVHGHLLSLFRAIRFVRLVRTLRLLRVVRMLKELHIIANSMMMAVKSLLWTVVLLALWTCIAGIVLTSTVTDYKVHMDHGSPEYIDLQNNFGTVYSTLLMLYESVSQGKEWSEPYNVLTKGEGCMIPGVVFLGYVTTTLFGIMNIFTSLFVKAVHETTIETKRDSHLENIASIFEGSVTQASFEGSLEDSRMQAYLQDIDLAVEDGKILFDLLDVEERGEITVEEFGSGCVRLHGYAKAIDLEFLGRQHRTFTTRFEQHASIIETQLSALLVNAKHSTSQHSLGSSAPMSRVNTS